MARRQPISPLRNGASLQRKSGRKPPRSITLIVCEGETEEAYFQAARRHFGLTSAEVVVAENTVGAAPISVVQCAETKCAEPGGYDKVYCVFDRDGHESFDRARSKIEALAGRRRAPLPIEAAISVPCFELWVLLHHERTDAAFARCQEVVDRIRHRHLPGYRKADATVSRQLVALIETAVRNADWLEALREANDGNPYTSVHRIIRRFREAAEQQT